MVALLLAMATGTARADVLTMSDQTFRIVWHPVKFVTSFGAEIQCNMTLEGAFAAREVVKATGSEQGTVTRASIASCSVGTITVLTATLPWEVEYQSFAGSLPNITAITFNIIGASFRFRTAGEAITCLMRSNNERPFAVVEVIGSGTVSEINAAELEILLANGLCPFGTEGRFTNRGRATTSGGGSITVSLT